MSHRETLHRLEAWLAAAPPGTMVAATALLERLREEGAALDHAPAPGPEQVASWRERLWTCPPETRLGVPETAEALGKSRSWVYRNASTIPHKRLGGELTFIVREVREWLGRRETPVVPVPRLAVGCGRKAS